ncbi:hypothetical protein ASF70_15755 [Rhizobium sp. Leaf321]|uniref:hypothetical protein n=1 Tax=Rhizobium sp. Leaf321 TaxID=1736335 RepID=UPI000715CCCD|nr:hypothetical protein [Rhizobium sp. Leaf321]KQQ72925.1 hypothetical protein ASF70_15755 [Rhizobium sp. Leaf321]
MSDFELLLTADSRGIVSGEKALDSITGAAEKAERQVKRSSDSMSQGMQSVGKSSIFATQQLRMQAMQLSQVAQQASATGNVLQAIAIQLPDLALGFGPIGIAAGAAAGAALSYFSSVIDNRGDASEALKEQETLIRLVADSWGEAVPALRDYVDQLSRAKEVSDLLAATDALANQSWDLARVQVSDLNIELAALVQDLQQAGAETDTILELQNAWSRVSAAIAEGKDDAAAMKDMQDALSAAISQTGIPAVGDFGVAFDGLSQTIAGALRQANAFKEGAIQALTVTQTQLGSLSPMWSENGQMFTDDQFVPKGDVPVPGSRGTPELSGFPWEEFNRQRTRRGGGRSNEAAKAEREKKAVADLISELEEELSLVNAGDAAKRSAAASRQAGAAATDGERQKIISLTEAIYQEEQAREALADQLDFEKDLTRSVIDDMKSALDDGKISWKEWADIGISMLDKITDKLLDDVLDSIFTVNNAATGSGGGGGLLSSLFGGLFGGGGSKSTTSWSSGLSDFKSFDGGGYTGAGARSGGLDGKGGFMALLHPDESVVDHSKGSARSSGVHVTSEVKVSVDQNGNLQAFVDRRSSEIADERSSAKIKQYDLDKQNLYANGQSQ